MDDTLSAAKTAKVDQLTAFLNQLDPTGNLSYTVEMPEENKIPCLDALFHRNPDGTLKTTVYRKKTHTDQYLNFSSHHPLHHKQGVVRTLIDRADALCSDPADKTEEYNHVSTALQRCGYSSKVIQNVIQGRTKSTSKPKKSSGNISSSKERKTMVVVPYVKGLSEKVQRIFKRHGIHCAMKPANTLRSMLVRPKDPRQLLDNSDVVYRIPGKNCDSPYIGETGRHLKCRISEHQASVKKVANRKYTRSRKLQADQEENKSALADHAAQTNHTIDWDNAKILASHCTNKKGRWIRESIWVRSERAGTVNRDEGGYLLPHVWDSLLGNTNSKQNCDNPTKRNKQYNNATVRPSLENDARSSTSKY